MSASAAALGGDLCPLRKFGDAVPPEGETAQVNEVLCKVLAHNLCVLVQAIYELGNEPMF